MPTPPMPTALMHITMRGEVQGIGLRPRIKRWADALGLQGWVRNQGDQVEMQVSGTEPALQQLLAQLQGPQRVVQSARIAPDQSDPFTQPGFSILPGVSMPADRLYQVPADRGICAVCLQEFHDPASSRHHYPFISCNDCGPRFSLLTRLPFARANTRYGHLPPCPQCQAEFADPENRRFHSELISCAGCGPRLLLGAPSAPGDVAVIDAALAPDQIVARAVTCLEQGGIVAVKSISGMQLLVRADSESAVQRLRRLKQRPHKPLALLVPSLQWVEQHAGGLFDLDGGASHWLTAPQRPIVLLPKLHRPGIEPLTNDVANAVAGDVPDLGIMLPATALQAWLALAVMKQIGVPLVCTSANISDEPILFRNEDLLSRVGGLCDLALLHDLEIDIPQDDSVLFTHRGRTTLLRRARGFAHATFAVPVQKSVLAVGGDLKNTFALAQGGTAILGPHLGDMESVATLQRQEYLVQKIAGLHDFIPDEIVADAHPGYVSRQRAQRGAGTLPMTTVQHHHAHLLANHLTCDLPDRYLALAWDGSGYGSDATLWGSECFLVEAGKVRRVAALAPFALPGGVQALRQPWRMALALSFAAQIPALEVIQRLTSTTVSAAQLNAVWQMLENNLNCPQGCAMGRLFDAASYRLLGVAENLYEGYAALQLQTRAQQEAIASAATGCDRLFAIHNLESAGLLRGDWHTAWRDLFLQDSAAPGVGYALAFHRGIAQWACQLARHFGVRHLSLSGGCFQNRLLQSLLLDLAQAERLEVIWPDTIPLNDGGLALGQLLAADYSLRNST